MISVMIIVGLKKIDMLITNIFLCYRNYYYECSGSLVYVDPYFALVIFVSSWCVSWGYSCVLCSDYSWSSLYDLSAYGSALFYYGGNMFGIVSCIGCEVDGVGLFKKN